MAMGGRFKWNDQGETPNTMFGIAEYPNGQQSSSTSATSTTTATRQVENEYYFEDGGKIVRGLYYPPAAKRERRSPFRRAKSPPAVLGSFVAACRAGNPSMANGNALEAHYGCVLGHLMNNSYRLGKKVPFNAKAGGSATMPMPTSTS
jgi:hypothetical protein